MRPSRQDTVLLAADTFGGSGKMKRDKSYHRGSASVKTTDMPEDDTVRYSALLCTWKYLHLWWFVCSPLFLLTLNMLYLIIRHYSICTRHKSLVHNCFKYVGPVKYWQFHKRQRINCYKTSKSLKSFAFSGIIEGLQLVLFFRWLFPTCRQILPSL